MAANARPPSSRHTGSAILSRLVLGICLVLCLSPSSRAEKARITALQPRLGAAHRVFQETLAGIEAAFAAHETGERRDDLVKLQLGEINRGLLRNIADGWTARQYPSTRPTIITIRNPRRTIIRR